MFSFPEGPEPTTLASPELGTLARLVVTVPHWTATLSITGNDLRPVEGLPALEPLGNGTEDAAAAIELPPGAYKIDARLGGNVQTLWVVATEGHETHVPAEMWDALSLTTSMPLASPIDGTPANDPLVGRAHELSYASTPTSVLASAAFTESRLFLFGRQTMGTVPEPSSWDIELLDEDGKPVARLQDMPPTFEPAFWSACLDLDEGYYLLRAREIATSERSAGDSHLRCQPIYLCAGWESHVFIECDQSPRLATMAFNMGRIGTGYRPDDEATIAAASVLAALNSGDARDTVIGAGRIEQLLRGEMHNPWLGVLAAYALDTGAPQADVPDLLADIIAFLSREIGDHPDVRALALEPDNQVALDYPPMLRAGLLKVRSSAAAGAAASVIAAGSTFAKVGQRLAADSAWTAWIEREDQNRQHGQMFAVQSEEQSQGDAAAEGPAPTEGAATMEVLGQALSSSAPVYVLATPSDSSSALTTKSFAEQVAIIEQAENILNSADGTVKSEVTVAAGASVDRILGIETAKVAAFMGTNEGMVEEGYRQLSQSLRSLENLDQESARAVQHLLASILDLKRDDALSGAAESEDEPGAQFLTPVEDQVTTLRQEARRLRSLAARTDSSPREQLERAMALADKLDEQAERLNGHAHLVIITDEDGRLLFGNRLLQERLEARVDPADVMKRLQRGLSSQPGEFFQLPASALSPTSPEALRGSKVDIHRTIVRDESGAIQAHIYVLRNADAKNFGAEVSQAIDTLLSAMSLHAISAQHGETDPSSSLDALQERIDDLDALLA